jgi:Flp pilus assembly protein CpaB
MKQVGLVRLLAVGTASAILISAAFAQDTSTTTTTTDASGVTQSTSTTTLSGSGTITSLTPTSDYIMVRPAPAAAQVRYYYTDRTVVVDPEGRTVAWSAIPANEPVTYTYVQEGGRRVITKVTLGRPVVIHKETTTTTTTTRKP